MDDQTYPAHARTLRFQGAANTLVRGLLRTPLLCRLVGTRLITLYVVGRKSGRRYSVPVVYTKHDGRLLVGTPFGWARNLRSGEPVDIRLKGRRRRADVEIGTEEGEVVADYATMCRDNRQFARFNQIRIDESGNPDPADLRAAWASGARTIRLRAR